MSAAPGPGPQEWSPYTSPVAPPPLPRNDASPGLAFILGLIPGVGAIYNGQYVKAFIHVIVLGLLISIVSSGAASGFEPLFGLLLGVWWLYMAFEAYHTAKRRQMGEPVDEFSSLVPLRHRGFPVGPIILIAFGLLFLLMNFNLISFEHIIRYWPLALIALGAWMLYERFAPVRPADGAGGGAGFNRPYPDSAPGPEVQHERQ